MLYCALVICKHYVLPSPATTRTLPKGGARCGHAAHDTLIDSCFCLFFSLLSPHNAHNTAPASTCSVSNPPTTNRQTEARVKKFLLDTSGSLRKTAGNCCRTVVRRTADKSKLDSCSSVTSCAVRLPSTLAR